MSQPPQAIRGATPGPTVANRVGDGPYNWLSEKWYSAFGIVWGSSSILPSFCDYRSLRWREFSDLLCKHEHVELCAVTMCDFDSGRGYCKPLVALKQSP